jgi:predicted AAA+ superfamily ATPase
MEIIKRNLVLPKKSFFLFGPRGVGKSFLMKETLTPKYSFNLLDQRLYFELSKDPGKIRDYLFESKKGDWVLIDEIQKIPALLDEVHYLIEEKKLNFALSGSSARKLKRSGANLLAGRALTTNLYPFSASELDNGYNLKTMLELGTLPLAISDPKNAIAFLYSYFGTYIKEEIKEEGLVRKIEPFLRFLEVAGILNGQQINSSNISRESKIARATVDTYFSILEDTLVGHFLRAYRPQLKVQEQDHPKFYWFDSGVARAAAGLLGEKLDDDWLGRALETLIFHELRSYNSYYQKFKGIFYYRAKSGLEVDFVIETKKRSSSHPAEIILIEVKYSKKWKGEYEHAMRSIIETKKIKIKHAIGLYMGDQPLDRGEIQVLPVSDFIKRLNNGDFF